jgi:2-amino-4-hydroxy-6-hydroxymethyldihydropteridine diphosphokinase
VPASRRTPVRVAVALGSNLGDRAGHIAWAASALGELLDDLRVSPVDETAPHDVPSSQPDYLNAVAVGWTRLSAHALLDALLALEATRGRTRPSRRAARTLDLDLVLYGSAVVDERGLVVPHARFRDRPFVLGPLAALAPRWRDPVTGQTMHQLWSSRRPRHELSAAGRPASAVPRGLSEPRVRRGRRGGTNR